jgi:hypothetical protein
VINHNEKGRYFAFGVFYDDFKVGVFIVEMEGEGRAGQLFGNYELFRDGDYGLHVADAGSVADVAAGHHVAVEEGKGHD